MNLLPVLTGRVLKRPEACMSQKSEVRGQSLTWCSWSALCVCLLRLFWAATRFFSLLFILRPSSFRPWANQRPSAPPGPEPARCVSTATLPSIRRPGERPGPTAAAGWTDPTCWALGTAIRSKRRRGAVWTCSAFTSPFTSHASQKLRFPEVRWLRWPLTPGGTGPDCSESIEIRGGLQNRADILD